MTSLYFDIVAQELAGICVYVPYVKKTNDVVLWCVLQYITIVLALCLCLKVSQAWGPVKGLSKVGPCLRVWSWPTKDASWIFLQPIIVLSIVAWTWWKRIFGESGLGESACVSQVRVFYNQEMKAESQGQELASRDLSFLNHLIECIKK